MKKYFSVWMKSIGSFGKLFFIIFILTGYLSAQITTLNEAENLARKYALQLQIAEKGVKIAKFGIRDAIGNGLPSISAYGQATTNHELASMIISMPGTDGIVRPMALTMGSKYSNTAGLSLSQPLFTGGAVFAGYKIAKEGVVLSKINQKMTIDNTVLTVRSFWYQYMLTNSLIEATEQALSSAKGNLELVNKKYNAGSVSQFELLQAKVSFEQLKPQIIQLKNQLKIIVTNLSAYLNDPDKRKIEPQGILVMENNPFENTTLENIIKTGEKNRLELQLMVSQKKILIQQRNIVMGQTLPMLSLSADLRQQAQAENKDDLDYLRSKSTSLNISIPLFSGGRKIASIQKSRVAIKEAELQEKQTRTFIRTEIESMYYKVEEAEKRITANATLVEQAGEALRLAELMYENGSSTQLDVQNARSAVLQAKSAHYSAIFEYNMALNQLKKSMNQL
ncbi:MAG: TolC family protein [Candidatus Marinimicrobia bacterium]|nr:TolC family protein [Candidatus Neomarinimicrobiota bacterium]